MVPGSETESVTTPGEVENPHRPERSMVELNAFARKVVARAADSKIWRQEFVMI